MGRRVADGKRNYAKEGHEYAKRVVSGAIPAGLLVRPACQRQLDDRRLSTAGKSEWLWQPELGNKVCRFIERLPHIKGRWSSKTIVLEPWQCFIVTVLFSWVNRAGKDKYRRFRTAYIEVPRKNAKTTLCAGIALFMLCADGEPGAEIYSAAVTRDQAKISWDIAQQMVKRDLAMQAKYGIEPLAHSIVNSLDGAMFKPLARDADSLEGLSPHCAIVDEVHAHKTREVWDVLNVARGSRRQSLLFGITTAGENKTGVCYEQHSYLEGILSSRHVDDRYFGLIYSIDTDDDWTTEESHRKANPNYGVSVLADDIITLCRQAQANAQSQNTFLTKRLNVWVSVGTAYFNILSWDRLCKTDVIPNDLIGCQCFFTIDLASKNDLTSRVMVFRRDGIFYVFGRHYLPGDVITAGNPNYDFYRGWAREGVLTLTDGNITDYDYVEHDLLVDVQTFKPQNVGVDPNYNAGQFTTRMLAAGVPIVEIAHNVMTFSEPMKQLEAMIMAGRIKHNGDPVFGWAMGNVFAKQDVKGNVYPRKARESDKIDPAVALIANLSLFGRFAEETWDFKVVSV